MVLWLPKLILAQEFPTTAKYGIDRSVRASKHDARFETNSNAFDVTYYHLTLNLNGLNNPILVGRNRIKGKALANLDTLAFDLSTNMVVDFVSLTSGRILGSSHENDQVIVALETTLLAGSSLELDIVYHGNPLSLDFGSFTSISDQPGKPNTIWTLSEPYGAKQWWPVDDQLTDKADSVRVTVHVPAPMSVASNGLLKNTIVHLDGSRTFDWLHRYPIAPYLVSLAIGNYDVYHQFYDRPPHLASEFGLATFPIDHFVYKGSDAFQGISPSSGWHLAVEMMAIFEDWLGPYPFAKEKYGHAHVTFTGGMEHQTMTSMGNIGAELIAHELAHQWFGNKLTPRKWEDLWLSEGFATMSEFLIYESDPKYAFLEQFLGGIYYDRALSARGTLVLQDTSDVATMFDFAGVYAKGYMVLKTLRSIVGDDVFKTILRTYTANPNLAYGSVSTRDFQQVVEQVAGRSFETFFSQWVYSGTGHPTYTVSATRAPILNRPFRTTFTINQIQTPEESNIEAFDVPLWLQVQTNQGTYLLQVENNQREQHYEVDLNAEMIGMKLDPDRRVLRGDPPVVSGLEGTIEIPETIGVSVYPNPTNSTFHVQVETKAGSEPVVMRIFDALGRQVAEDTRAAVGAQQLQFNVNPVRWSPGVYAIQIRRGSERVHRMVIVSL